MNTQGVWHLNGYNGDVSIPVSGTLRINDDGGPLPGLCSAVSAWPRGPTFIVGKDLQEGRLVEASSG